MKTLNKIQTFMKIGMIISKVIYICCIVGFIGCCVSCIAMLIGAQALKLNGMSIEVILLDKADMSEGTLWASILAGAILCVGEYLIARMSYLYFQKELKVGTPFTEEGAKELFHLGISVIWIPLVAIIVAEIIREIIIVCMGNVEKLEFDGFENIMLGIMFIIISFIFKYGAELKEYYNKKETEKNN